MIEQEDEMRHELELEHARRTTMLAGRYRAPRGRLGCEPQRLAVEAVPHALFGTAAYALLEANERLESRRGALILLASPSD